MTDKLPEHLYVILVKKDYSKPAETPYFITDSFPVVVWFFNHDFYREKVYSQKVYRIDTNNWGNKIDVTKLVEETSMNESSPQFSVTPVKILGTVGRKELHGSVYSRWFTPTAVIGSGEAVPENTEATVTAYLNVWYSQTILQKWDTV